jgi:hypothetical protein
MIAPGRPDDLAEDLDLLDERLVVVWERRTSIPSTRCIKSRVPVRVVELGQKFSIVEVPTLFEPIRAKARTCDLLFVVPVTAVQAARHDLQRALTRRESCSPAPPAPRS